jgi:hypothetical protein
VVASANPSRTPWILQEKGKFCFLNEDGSVIDSFKYDRLASFNSNDDVDFRFDYSEIVSQRKFEESVLDLERKFLSLQHALSGSDHFPVPSSKDSLSDQLADLVAKFPFDLAYKGPSSISRSFAFNTDSSTGYLVDLIISVSSATSSSRVVYRAGFVIESEE